MAQKEKQQTNQLGQEEFVTRSCYIITKEHLIQVTSCSTNYQSVTVYRMENGGWNYQEHLTFSIDVNKEKNCCLVNWNECKELPEGFVTKMLFNEYIYSMVYDTMMWMEFWKEDHLDEDEREIAKFWNELMAEIVAK